MLLATPPKPRHLLFTEDALSERLAACGLGLGREGLGTSGLRLGEPQAPDLKLQAIPPRRILLIAYHFPPHGGSGVQRPLKLARYLPDCGWSVNVLTTAHDRYPLLDPTLLGEVPPTVAVHRQAGWEPADLVRSAWLPAAVRDRLYWRLNAVVNRLPLPETQLLWIPAAARAAERLVRNRAIDVILTTSPPHSVHLIGRRLQRRFGIPWIADLRDPIIGNFSYAPRSASADRFYQRMEATILQHADAIITTCDDLTARLRERHPLLLGSRIHTVANGFDPDDALPRASDTFRDRFILAHVGAFYAGQHIEPILAALRRLRVELPGFAARSEFRVIGSISAAQRRTLDHADLSTIVETGYQPHRAAIGEMAAADLLLLMTPDSPGGRLCIPAKTFEYLAFGKRIVALVHPETHLERILLSTSNCRAIHHGNHAQFIHEIACAFTDWENRIRWPHRELDSLHAFDRRTIAARFARIANDLIAESSRRHRGPTRVSAAR